MNQFRSFITQYASNAAERVACHYKERSLTFRIVASSALSRAPSSPPADSIRPAAHGICRGSLRMATPQQKVFCVLEFARTNSVVTVQRAFRRRFHNVHYRPSPKNIRRWFQQLQDTGDSRGKCCERQVGLSRLEGRREHD
jgi:hypothetical protein